MKHTRLIAALAAAFATLAVSPLAQAQNLDRHFLGFKAAGNSFQIATSDGRNRIKPYSPNIVKTSFVPSNEEGKPQAASHAVVLAPSQVPVKVQEDAARIVLATDGITVTVEK